MRGLGSPKKGEPCAGLIQMHELEVLSGSTTPFHTFDPCEGERLERTVSAIQACTSGDESSLLEICAEEVPQALFKAEGIEVGSRSDIPWDDATLAWMLSLPSGESIPEPLDNGKARERLGRYPWGDGSPISYLIAHLTSPSGEEDSPIIEHLGNLQGRLSAERTGNDSFSNGAGRLCLCGYLMNDEVGNLRRLLMTGAWGVSADEPYDGGVREVVKHLVVILRGAQARGVGVLLRSHS